MEFEFSLSAVGSHWRVQNELINTVNRSCWLLCGEQIVGVTGGRETSWKMRNDGDLDQGGSNGDVEEWMDLRYIL